MKYCVWWKNNDNQQAHTNTHAQPFYGSMEFVRDNVGELVPEETFTHSINKQNTNKAG